MNNISFLFQFLPKLIISKQIIDFLINILIILFTIIVVSFFNRKNIKHKIIVGIILGLLSIMLLMNPVVLANGSYYDARTIIRSEEHTSELQSRPHLVCRLLLEKKNKTT